MLPFQKMLSYTILQEKHHDLKTENGKIWKIRKVRAIPIVTGALGGVTKSLEKWAGKFDIQMNLPLMQKTALWGTTTLLKKILELKGEKYSDIFFLSPPTELIFENSTIQKKKQS